MHAIYFAEFPLLKTLKCAGPVVLKTKRFSQMQLEEAGYRRETPHACTSLLDEAGVSG